MTLTATQRADLTATQAAGSNYLDRTAPEWRGQIDTAALDIAMNNRCIMGQLCEGDYINGIRNYSPIRTADTHWAVMHGFYVDFTELTTFQDDMDALSYLTALWIADLQGWAAPV